MVAPFIFWADRVTTRRSTGHTPFFMIHGIEPILPFNLELTTFLVPNIDGPLTTEDLLAIRTRQLEKRQDDFATIRERILASRYASACQFEKTFEHTLCNYDF